ncbi:uncharacterized protein LOC111693696 [Trichogramma pretiosum]|uniref:uncharacterized protein LOC111693696 n=1 Tax=Trichogramma pretiosum TaxID=7493 RepID=UPI000C719C39|nr:uncharacterized protein LOC111693696 [Trichogramma pretiosum]
MPSHLVIPKAEPDIKLKTIRKRKDQQQHQNLFSNGPEIPGVPCGRELLASIDLIRQRKARPNQSNLINYMLKNYKIDREETLITIKKMIELEHVVEVIYKGSISYRNASNWKRLPLYMNRPEAFRKDKINSETISDAFSQLILQEPDYLNTGIPAPRLIDHLLNGHSNPTTQRMVEDFLKKEVSQGKFEKLLNGNYLLVGSSNMSGGSVTINASIPNQVEILNITSDSTFYDDNSSYSPHNDNTLLHTNTNITNNTLKKEDCFEIIMGKDWIPNGQIHESNNNITDINSTKSFENHSSQDITNYMFDLSSDNEIEPYNEIKDVLKEKYFASLNLIRTSLLPSVTNNTGSVRAPKRIIRVIRVKKVFDPSDNFIVKKKRSKQPKTMPTKPKTMSTKPNATIPQENRETVTHSQNKETSKDEYCHRCSSDKPDSLVECEDCTTKVHLSCALPSKETSKKALIDWRCERCKMCEVCHETVESGAMVSCYKCDRASHIKCLSDKKTQKASKWECQDCQTKRKSPSLEKVSKSSDSMDASEVTNRLKAEIKKTANSPKISEVIHNKITKKCENKKKIDPNIPDVRKWTVEQVFLFFSRYFPRHAQAFKEHEIDGASLLLLTKKAIIEKLGGLHGKLGPALKIYKQVVILKARYDDTALYWL